MAYESPPIIFSNLPLLQELYHVLVSIDPKEIKDTSVKSDYQWQLLKTRILLFSDYNILASPMLGELRYIHLVCKQAYYINGCLAKLLEKNRLKVEMVSRLTLEIYEICLMHAFITKLAPSWNRVEKMFIESRYFLLKRGELGAVELSCTISDDKLLLHVHPLRLWLTAVDLLDFHLPVSILEHSVSEKFYKDLSHESQWVHVLPSFKRGRVVFVSNYIPKECTFANYKQMRYHWKNMYGFRLPEEGSSMLYVGVNFFGPLDYTYPSVCVRRTIRSNIGDPKLILNFIDAVKNKASVICGVNLKLANLGVSIQTHFMVESKESKWDEKNLLTIEKHVLENFIFPIEEEDLINNQISLFSQIESDCESIHLGSSNIPDYSYDELIKKYSNFIEGLLQVKPPNRRTLRAFRKPLATRPRQFIKESLEKPILFVTEKSSDVKKNESDKEKLELISDLNEEDNNNKELFYKQEHLKAASEKKTSQVRKPATTFTENEIEDLHRVGKLNKVNKASLYNFLIKNGIQCKRIDKKQLLLSRAELLLSQYLSKAI